jgi:hypothetical protein
MIKVVMNRFFNDVESSIHYEYFAPNHGSGAAHVLCIGYPDPPLRG